MSVVSRGFASDGIDYVLPLPKGISGAKNANPTAGSYAPSAADWSMDEDIETSNRRFARENSTISIDSTEFSGHPQTRKENDDVHRNIAEYERGETTVWPTEYLPYQ